MGNTPPTTIEDNKISFALPSKFPFSYSNHPQGLKTSNSEKKLGFLNLPVSAVGCFGQGSAERVLDFFRFLNQPQRCLYVCGCQAMEAHRSWRAGAEEKVGLSRLDLWRLSSDSQPRSCQPDPRVRMRRIFLGRWLLVKGHAIVGLPRGTSMLRTEHSHNSGRGKIWFVPLRVGVNKIPTRSTPSETSSW